MSRSSDTLEEAAMRSGTPVDVTVTRTVAASPETLYDLVSDVTQMARWSPETVAARWLDDARGPAVGARFAGTNKLGKLTWTTKPTVTAAERGSVFAFTVPGRSGPTWTYTFTPAPGGTTVTESAVQERRSPLLIRMLQRRAGVTDRAGHLRAGMSTTLERLAAAATAEQQTSVRPDPARPTRPAPTRKEFTMDYMFLIHSDETAEAPAPGSPQFEQMMAGWMAYNQSLIDGGHWIAAANLQPTVTASSVHKALGSAPTITDGPFAETKEQLGGFYLITADDLDQALELAGRLPLPVGTIEVRPVAFRPDAA
jgi:uncharacterized protein YndB with AHSA1/START domain